MAPSIPKTPRLTGDASTIQSSVLVVDHEATIREVVCRFLEKNGYRSLGASSAEEAAAILEDAAVVAVLLDARLTGPGSGLDLLAQLRRRPGLATTPAILMTRGTLSEEQQTALDQNAGLLYCNRGSLTALIGFLRELTGRPNPATAS